MTLKPFLLVLLCSANAAMLIQHIRLGNRRVVFSMCLCAIAWLGLSPILYELLPKGWYPRHTISWPMLCVLASMIPMLTPGLMRADKYMDVTDPNFDTIPPTGPAPLEPKQPTVH